MKDRESSRVNSVVELEKFNREIDVYYVQRKELVGGNQLIGSVFDQLANVGELVTEMGQSLMNAGLVSDFIMSDWIHRVSYLLLHFQLTKRLEDRIKAVRIDMNVVDIMLIVCRCEPTLSNTRNCYISYCYGRIY